MSQDPRDIIPIDPIDPSVPPEEAPLSPRPAFEHVERVDQTPGGVERRERQVVDRSGAAHYEAVTRDYAAEQRLRQYRTEQVIWLVLGIVEVLIGLRVFLLLIAANPQNGFAELVYGFSAFFVAPFAGLTGSPTARGSVLDLPALIAMVVYYLLAWGIIKITRLAFVPSGTRSVSTYDRYRS